MSVDAVLIARPATEASAVDARTVYSQRLEQHEASVRELKQSERRMTTGRVVVFLAGLLLAVIAWGSASVSLLWLLLPAVVFVVLVVIHDGLVRRLRQAERAAEFNRVAIDRLNDVFSDQEPTGEEFRPPESLFAGDLDLLGDGSVFQRICRARTGPGQRRLSDWLLNVPAASDVVQRQRTAEALRNEYRLRERLAIAAERVEWARAEASLSAWTSADERPISVVAHTFAWALALTATVLVPLILLDLIPWSLLLLILIGQLCVSAFCRQAVVKTFESINEAEAALRQLSGVTAELESASFNDPWAEQLRRSLGSESQPASQLIARLARLSGWLNNAIRNQFFAPIAWLLGLLVILTRQIESWRQHHGSHVIGWLEAVGTLEALLSVAGRSFENPKDVLPEIIESGPPELNATAMGHPLLANADCVRNDVSLSADVPMVIISGSNMSGKSTYLRAVGVNLVLAWTGSRVRAASMKTTVLHPGTAMRVSDSLQEGRSLFLSVLLRLRSVVELAKREDQVLFLLDEILQGTNSHDRRIGAAAVLRSLVDSGAIGIVTTHDLALTRIAEDMNGRAVNRHFRDDVADGEMTFDYRLREGVVDRSNAIQLMSMLGLDVGTPE